MSAALSPEPGDGWDEEAGAQQGLYVTLPAGELSLDGFAADGRADTMAPGPLLAMVLGAVAGEDGQGLAGLSDDQLIGFLSGARRMESHLAWAQMAALAEFASRPRRQDFAADEVAAAFSWTWHGAAGKIGYATAVAARLPATFAALAAGMIDPVHVKIIEEVTGILSEEDAARADAELAGAAQGRTYGALRAAASRLVLRLDAEAVRKRKEKARGEARVRAFREESGNAGITGRELPSVEVLASMQHVEDRARALRDAGVPGTWQELKVRATLDLLQERDSRPAPGGPPAGAGAEQASGPGAQITITVPHRALGGDSGPPAEVAGFGILDHADARDLVAAAARNPATRWCVTVLNPDGTAAAHGCGTGPRQWPPGHGPPGPVTTRGLLEFLGITNLTPVIRGPCQHARAEPRYRPSRKLQHLIRARNATCAAPGCGRRAASCDLDHTSPHHHGGRTCECNLAPLCRHHHRCKQAEGWSLEQPEPGVLAWHTPVGRTYTTTPTQYAI
jgi:Domain of unknown function (DUF222)